MRTLEKFILDNSKISNLINFHKKILKIIKEERHNPIQRFKGLGE